MTQDIYLPVRNKQVFEETLLDTIIEGISNEQKEIAQRALSKKNMQVAIQLREYLNNKWKNNKKSKEDFNQAKSEYERLFFITKKIAELGSKSDKQIKKYLDEVIGIVPQWLTVKSNSDDSSFEQAANKETRVALATGEINNIKPGDFRIGKVEDKKLEKIIRQEIALHEYGHLFNWLKKYIVTGEIPKLEDTMELAKNGKYEEIENLEGKANAYAIDNIYRKDRRELLKKSDGYRNLDKSIKSVRDERKGKQTKLTLADLYRYGANKESKTLNPTLKSIRLEEANKSNELKNIQNFANQIKKRFEDLGYKVPNIVCTVRDNYTKQKRNMYPIFTDANNGRKVFIDIDAYEDLSKSKEAIMFYLPHEIAHIISREDHGGKLFNEVVNNWNKKYNEKILADPEDEDKWNKKFLPTYFKKVSWLDSVKPDKENNISADEIADDGMKNKIWKENYFPY